MRNLAGMRGPKPSKIEITDDERSKLEMLVRRPKTAQRMALRARIVLMAADGAANLNVAKELKVSRATVIKWRERFRTERLDGLLDEPRVQAPRVVTDDLVEQLVTTTLESTPTGKTHWSQRDMASHVGLSRATVARIWRAFALQPHRVETFKLSPDPQFVEKVRDIVGLYMNPPENAVVLCVDEKSQIQALERTQPILPLRPGVPEQQTHDYARNGTTTLFAALNAHTGTVVRKCYRRHRAKEYLSFLRLLDSSLPQTDAAIHIVVDNYATHKTPAVQRWFAKHPRFHVHFTPTYASWLNMVERLFAEVTDKAIRRGSFPSVASLERAIEQYLAARDDKPYVWTASADTILTRVGKYCLRTNEPAH
jgi:transcriptional regulator with XRE-family HTH domain